jgi:RNA polymerase sigma-70 factor (ECF subfamily)
MKESHDTEHQDSSLKALIARAQQGDMVAFRELVELEHGYFFATALRFLHDRDKAADVVQEAWIRIWKHLASYRPETKFTTWSYRIVIHLCLDTVRGDNRRRAVQEPLNPERELGNVFPGVDPDEAIDARDLCSRVLAASRTLPPKEHLAFQLRDVQDLSIPEIAEVMAISEAAVRANLCHARKRIRTMVGRAEGMARS